MSNKRLGHTDLTPEQRAVLDANGDLLVVGMPGTGKTSIALLKAVKYVAECRDEDAQVLFLSFSRAAVQRIEAAARIYVPRTAAKRLHITTFHAFCFDVLNSHARLVGMPRLAGIVLPHEERMIVAEAARAAHPELPPPSDPEQEDDLDAVVDQALDVLMGQRTADEASGRSRALLEATLARVTSERVRLERQEGRVPFERLLDLVMDLFRRHAALCLAYARAFPLILIDEYQDTNDKQDELIDRLAAHGQAIYLGDPEQRIYDWIKDVRADRFERLMARRRPTRVDLPATCHRSGASDLVLYGKAVLHGASLTFRPADVALFRYAPGNWGKKLRVGIMAAWATARKRMGEGAHPEIAIMSYKNSFVARMSTELRTTNESFDKPFHHRLQVGLEEVAPAWALALALLELPSTAQAADAVADGLHQFARFERSRGGIQRTKRGDALAETAEATRTGGKVGARALRDLQERLSREAGTFTGDAKQDIRKIIGVLRATGGKYFDEAVNALDLRSPAAGCEALIEQLAAAYATHGSYRGARAMGQAFLLREYLVRAEAGSGGLVVMTLHKCKGKEFDAVVIMDGPGEADGLIVRGDDDKLSRSRRLLAMAIARARYNVVIVTPGYRECQLLPSIPKPPPRAKARARTRAEPAKAT